MSYPLFLTVTTVTVTNMVTRSLLTITFLYQAIQRPQQFKIHLQGIAFHIETIARADRPEVGMEGAVVASGDGDAFTLIDVGFALHLLLRGAPPAPPPSLLPFSPFLS